MEFKFILDYRLGDNDVTLEGEMDEDGCTYLNDVRMGDESIYEMLASVAMTANPKNGFTILENKLTDYCAERYGDVMSAEREARAEYNRDLRDDR